MLTSLRCQNFRILKNATLPLAPSTLILGPNSSGKSTALQALRLLCEQRDSTDLNRYISSDMRGKDDARVEISATFLDTAIPPLVLQSDGEKRRPPSAVIRRSGGPPRPTLRLYAFDPNALSAPVALQPNAELSENGANLPAVLTQLQDQFPEQFDALNQELRAWLPQFDRILFDTPAPNQRRFMLRGAMNRQSFPASHLSHGILFALAILTLVHLPLPPDILCLEEPDRGIHPRLLRNVYEAIQRLAFPEASGAKRKATQVICTSHSPYLLDFYRDHPENIVLSELTPDGAVFRRLSDISHLEDIIRDVHLGDAWYTGILGGVPAAS